jgi:divalent metal cation (Fe/Co/Zn/Cd) transporter
MSKQSKQDSFSSHEPAQRRWLRIASALVIGTLCYNVIEAGLALWSGLLAGSISLVGFGFDSVIETIAAGALLWRLRRERREGNQGRLAELDAHVHRVVGGTFVLLSVYVAFQASWSLGVQAKPSESLVGVGVAIASVIVMPAVSFGKIRAARRLGSRALLAEAKETLACSYLSVALLLGLLLNSAFGWWWADPIAALLMLPWIVHEGIEGLRGND